MSQTTKRLMVCRKCASHPDIRVLIEKHGVRCVCSYCQRKSLCLKAKSVFNFIKTALQRRFQRYCNADDPILEAGYRTSDLIERWEPDFANAFNGLFLEHLCSYISVRWLDPLFTYPSPYLHIYSLWQHFKEKIKAEKRYFPLQRSNGTSDTELIELLQLIVKSLRDYNCILTLPRYTKIYRVIDHSPDKSPSSAADLGPAPPEVSADNRFSAAGISGFYASRSYETAVLEILKKDHHKKSATIGTWESLKPIRILDLSRDIENPSIFDPDCYRKSAIVLFLRDIICDLHGYISPYDTPIDKHPLADPHRGVSSYAPSSERVPGQALFEYLKDILKVKGVQYMTSHCPQYPFLVEGCEHMVNYALFFPASAYGESRNFRKYTFRKVRHKKLPLTFASVLRFCRSREKQQETEGKQQDEKKYSPSPDAVKEWVKFRNYPHLYKGTITTWNIQVLSINSCFDSNDYTVFALLDKDHSRWVRFRLTREQLHHYNVREKDHLIFTGKLIDISDNRILIDGIKSRSVGLYYDTLLMYPILIKNQGLGK